MNPIYTSMESLIGRTPLVHLQRMGQDLDARVLAKLEGCNPAGSAKDRVALAMLLDAEEKGLLPPGGTVIEPTSGNTGIGLAAVAAVRGYRAIIVMPDSMSVERQLLMKAYGAEVILTPGAEGMAAAIAKAEADKEIAMAQAQARKEANDARIEAETQIAVRNNDLRIREAELKRLSDIKQADADAAYGIQREEQRRTIEVKTVDANIARQEREAVLKQREVEVTEYTLEATVKKRAEADLYSRQKQAEAELFERQKQAEAELAEAERELEKALPSSISLTCFQCSA